MPARTGAGVPMHDMIGDRSVFALQGEKAALRLGWLFDYILARYNACCSTFSRSRIGRLYVRFILFGLVDVFPMSSKQVG